MAEDINITADFSDLIEETTKAYNLTVKQVEALKKYLQVTVQVTEKLDKNKQAYTETTATITSQISEFQKLNAVIKDTGDGYEFVRGKVTQLNKELSAEAKASQDAANAAKAQANAEKDRAAALDKSQAAADRLDKRLNDLAAKNSAAAAKQNRVAVLDSVVRDQTGAERTRLQGLGTDLGGAAQGKLIGISRAIAEVGVKAGLTARGLQDLFAQVNAGNFGQIESKYAGVVAAIVRYNATIQSERDKLAKGLNSTAGNAAGGTPPAIPSVTGEMISRGLQYVNVLGRIQGTLTNLALYRGFNFLTKSITESVTSAREFETKVALIRTLSQDATLSAGQWTQGLKVLSTTLGTDFADVADAAYESVSSQLTRGADTFQYVETAGKLAKVAGTDIKTAGQSLQSVLNSYSLSADKADEVSAQLFKTIDNGNVKLKDFAGTFGRVGTLGQELGVEREELLAFISTFTRAGVSTSDAITYLNNVMTKLLQPTDATKAALDEVGIASAKSAVKVTSLRAVLSKLIEAEASGKGEVIDFFPEIRGEKGAALFKQNIKGIDKDLDDIRNKSQDYFAKAKDIVFSTDAQKIQETVETFKNALASTVGKSFNKLVADTLTVRDTANNESPEAFIKRMDEAAQKLFRTIAGGAVTIGAFVVGLRTLGIIAEINAIRTLRAAQLEAAETAARVRNTAAIGAEAAATARLNAVKGGGVAAGVGANPLVAAGIAAASLYAGYSAYKSIAVDTFSSTSEAVDELFRKLKTRDTDSELQKSVDTTKKLKDEFKDAAKAFAEGLQAALAKNNVALGDIREKIKLSQDGLKEGFVAAISLAQDKLDGVRERISQINSLLKNSGLRTAEFGDKQRDAVYNTNQKYANPEQQLRLIEKEYNRIKGQIADLVKQNTPEAFHEAEKLYDKLATLQTQYYEKDADHRNTRFQEQAKEQGLTGKQTFYYDDSAQQASANGLLKERIGLQKKEKEILDAKLEKEKESEALKKKELQKTKDAITNYENFSLTDAQGNVKADYRNKQGTLDPEKAKAAFKRVVEELRSQVPTDVSARIGLKGETDKREGLLNEQIIRETGGKKIVEAEKGVANSVDVQNKALDDAQKKVKEYQDAVTGLVGELKTLNAAFKDTATKTTDNIVSDQSGGGPLKGVREGVIRIKGVANPDGSRVDRSQKAFDPVIAEASEIDKMILDLPNKIIVKAGQRVTDPAAVQELIDKIKALKAKLIAAGDTSIEAFNIPNATGGSLNLSGTKNTLDESLKILEGFQSRFGETKSGLEKSSAELEAAQARVAKLTADLKGATAQFDALQKSLTATGQTGVDSTEAQLKKFAELADLAERTAKRIQQAKDTPPGVDKPAGGGFPVGPDDGTNWSIVPNPKFMGGPIYKAYGGPIGQDNVPLWAAHGEFMMNKGATSRFYSQIASMNSTARIPQYFNKGGPVTNMGGVNISVNESKNPQVTAREIQRLLNRSKRMGNS